MSDVTIYQAYEKYMMYGSSFWADRTKDYYVKNLGYFLRYLEEILQCPVDQIMVGQLPADILAQYVVHLRNQPRFTGHPARDSMNINGRIKANTVNSYMRAVKAFMNYCYKCRFTSIKLTEDLRLPRSDSDQIVPLLADEVRQIDGIFDRSLLSDLRNLCIIHVMLDAGLRSSEVCNLKPGDIVFSSNSIIVNQGKGSKSRVVILASPLKEMLQEYMSIAKPSGRLFRKSRVNKPIDTSVMRALFLRIVRNTGINRIHPHLLRHTFATSYIIGGGNLETLRILLGHSDYTVTRTYLHLAAQYKILGAKIYRLDPVFFKSGY